jgi:hypothetical protein
VVGWGSAVPFSASYITTASQNPGSGTSFTFNTISIGTAPGAGETRYIVLVVGFEGTSNQTITGATYNGSAASLVVASSASQAATAIFVGAISSGTTANFVVTTSGNVRAVGIGVYRLINPGSSGAAYASTSSETPSGNVLTLSVNSPTSGYVIGVTQVKDGSGATMTWSGLTENYDYDIRSGDIASSASLSASGTPVAITATRSVSSTVFSGCAASWGP